MQHTGGEHRWVKVNPLRCLRAPVLKTTTVNVLTYRQSRERLKNLGQLVKMCFMIRDNAHFCLVLIALRAMFAWWDYFIKVAIFYDRTLILNPKLNVHDCGCIKEETTDHRCVKNIVHSY